MPQGTRLVANSNYQCGTNGCRKRYSFPKPIESYKRTPRGLTEDLKCGACKRGTLHPTRKHLVRQRQADRGICRCSRVPAPHRIGASSIMLRHHPGIYSCESAPAPAPVEYTGEPGDDVPF